MHCERTRLPIGSHRECVHRVLAAAASLNSYVSQLTVSFQGVASMDSPVVAGTMAAATVLIVGACLLLAPVIFGPDWLSYAIPIMGVLIGVVGSNFFLNTAGGYYEGAHSPATSMNAQTHKRTLALLARSPSDVGLASCPCAQPAPRSLVWTETPSVR